MNLRLLLRVAQAALARQGPSLTAPCIEANQADDTLGTGFAGASIEKRILSEGKKWHPQSAQLLLQQIGSQRVDSMLSRSSGLSQAQ